MALWILDAACGGQNIGVTGDSGVKESNFVLEAVLEAKKHLERNSEKVILTRSEDVDLTIDDRVKFANNSNGDFFVSFHMNHSSDKNNKGVKILLVNDGEEDYRLGKLIRDEILSELRTDDLGVTKDYDGIYKNLNMMGIIVYGEYLSNEEVLKELDPKKYGMMVAKAMLAFRDKVLLLEPVSEPKKLQKQAWRLCIGYYKDYDEVIEAMMKLHNSGVKNAYIAPYDGS